MQIADEKLDSHKYINETIGRQSTFIRLSVIALLVTYVTTIELGFRNMPEDWSTMTRRATALVDVVTRSNSRGASIAEEIRKAEKPDGKIDNKKQNESSARTAKLIKKLTRIHAAAAAISADLRPKVKEISDRLAASADVGVQGFSLRLPASLLHSAWLCAASFLLLYAAFARRRGLAAINKAIVELNARQSSPPPELLDMPYWLLPLPWERKYLRPELTAVLENSGVLSKSMTAAWVGISLACLIVCLRVATLDAFWGHLASVVTLPSVAMAITTPGQIATMSGSQWASLALFTFALCAFLLSLVAVEADPRQIDPERRSALLGLAAAGGLASLPLIGFESFSFRKLQQRNIDLFRRLAKRTRRLRKGSNGPRSYWRHGPTLKLSKPEGFYRRPHSLRFHYVDRGGYVLGLDAKARVDLLRRADDKVLWHVPPGPMSDSLLFVPLWSRFRIPLIVEKAVLQSFEVNDRNEIRPTPAQCVYACKLLLNGIQVAESRSQESPPLRLYDLAAGIAYRYGVQDVLKELIAKTEQPRFAPLLASRRHSFRAALKFHAPDLPQPLGVKFKEPLQRWARTKPRTSWGTFVTEADTRANVAGKQEFHSKERGVRVYFCI